MINWTDNHDEDTIRFQTLRFEQALRTAMKRNRLKPFEYRALIHMPSIDVDAQKMKKVYTAVSVERRKK